MKKDRCTVPPYENTPPPPPEHCRKCGAPFKELLNIDGIGPSVLHPPFNRVEYHNEDGEEFLVESCWRCGYSWTRPTVDQEAKGEMV